MQVYFERSSAQFNALECISTYDSVVTRLDSRGSILSICCGISPILGIGIEPVQYDLESFLDTTRNTADYPLFSHNLLFISDANK